MGDTVREAYDNDMEDFLEAFNGYADLMFRWKGKPYFIDSVIDKRKHLSNRRISELHEEPRYPILETSKLYSLHDITDMLNNHYIDGERLGDIIMECEVIDIY